MKKLTHLFWGWLAVLSLFFCTSCSPADPGQGYRPEGSEKPVNTSSDAMQVYFIDVGQGDSTLVTCGGEAMLIDAGDNSSGTAIQMFLEKQGITELRYVVGTHPDSDHIGGLDVVISKFDCGTILMPTVENDTATYRDVISAMDYKGYRVTSPVVGDTYRLGNATFTILAPNRDYEGDTNNWSVGLLLEHGKNRFLFTGDSEEEAERDIVENGIDITCDVYKTGHHGSNTSSSQKLLDAASPGYAVISCGEDNSYGHPRAETLIHFRERGIQVFRTDEQGTILAESDGEEIHFDMPPSTSWKAGEPTGGGGEKPSVKGTGLREGEEAGKTDYVLNTSSKKFHRPTCEGLPGKNRRDVFMSRDDVVNEGYEPCKICNP